MTSSEPSTVPVDLGGHIVDVPKGGLYERFRMDPDLDAIATDPLVPGVEFFRGLPKTRIDSPIGPTWTPNFYYLMSSARLVMVAPSSAIRRRLPATLTPLEVAPGLGLVSVMFFRYDICDVDFYTEAAVGVAVRPARHGGPGIVDLVSALADNHLHSYVLSLPVNTEIAQVRGRYGYGLPKWVTEIDVAIDARRTHARVANDEGGIDIAFTAPTPGQTEFATGERVSSLTSYSTIDDDWLATLSQTNMLKTGTTRIPRKAQLELGSGRMTDDLRSLKPLKTIQLDVMTEGQNALHMPVPISVRDRRVGEQPEARATEGVLS